MNQRKRCYGRRQLILSYLRDNSEGFFTSREITCIIIKKTDFGEIKSKSSNVTVILKALVKEGLIFRYRQESNKRIIVYSLNSKVDSKLYAPFNNYSMNLNF